MSRKYLVALCFGLLLVSLGLWTSAQEVQPSQPPAGTIGIKGSPDGKGQLVLEIMPTQARPEDFKIVGVEIHSQVANAASERFLAAILDNGIPDSVAQDVAARKPESTMRGIIGQMEPTIILPEDAFPGNGPPERMLTVVYILERNGAVEHMTIGEINLIGQSGWDITAYPGGGGSYTFCGSCGGVSCGCKTCPSPRVTLACPACTIQCGAPGPQVIK